MSLVVQKFGGTSVADVDKIRAAAQRAIATQQAGHQVVMVVSAMGKQTDFLVSLAADLCKTPPAREMDMLLSTGEQVSVSLMAMAIHALGSEAVSLTGGQIGIRTDSSHTKARIQSISTERIQKFLDKGKIVIAAGFQGIDEDFNITTLGRGGSDTTAVALAAVLGADRCEIYTDVDGVYTTDPRLLPEARKLDVVSHDEMLELASLGAGVMHSRSIEFGKKFGVPIYVRYSGDPQNGNLDDKQGTLIGSLPESIDRAVSGAALTQDEAQFTITGVPDQPGTSLAIFSKLADVHVVVDMIVQNIGTEGRADISFTVLGDDLALALEAVEQVASELRAEKVHYDKNVSKVSIVGLGMATQTGVADRMFRVLADQGINIEAITTSDIKISVLVAREQGLAALQAVHREFELEKPADERARFGEKLPGAKKPPVVDPADVVDHLQHMEDLTIEGITLDATQARVTFSQVPDQPGIVARIFEGIAAHSILIDMIVQSTGHDGLANVSFTVPRKDLAKSCEVVEQLARDLKGTVTHEPEIAILTVTGIGIRSHTGVGIRLFEALTKIGINVDMINTSEMRVNAAVDGKRGEEALAALKRAFADVVD